MKIRHFNPQLSFSGALSADDFASLNQQGYTLIVNNRPDEEQGDFLLHSEEQSLARDRGMDYFYLPFTFDTLTWDRVYAFNRLLRSAKKTLAHCRSGSRSVCLFLLYELHNGLINETTFRETCFQYEADAEKALAWYACQQETEAQAEVHHFYEPVSGSMQYIVADPASRRCAIIDPVLDFDSNSATVSCQQAQKMLDFIHLKNWQVAWILDTHPHADHFSAASWLAEQTGAFTAIGEKVAEVQALWKKRYNLCSLPAPESIWDTLFSDGDIFYVGNLRGEAIFSPGHTLASVTYHIGNCAFIHDTLFMPDSGTARTDFPGGSAEALWHTLQRILQLPEDTRLFTGHDYRPGGRPAQCESTVMQQRNENPWLINQDKDSFVIKRNQRDATLPLPGLMLMALQVNINGGRLPPAEDDGHRYLKIPLNRF
ncbi:MBL fold metallo-hydrolase [Erwinia psidii]|uniref:bifunctional sulfur transferase/dioxygenase Blh n=1 Tax=Erwinia psidii TaxID=69224 RepID=UPI00226B6ACE|nr:bifunctional sulfur transferase/dioxygenase Blh [Erwinia psidii]MCX8964036.1 MBL fold metallo-hydrolase [Erwinia psidii]